LITSAARRFFLVIDDGRFVDAALEIWRVRRLSELLAGWTGARGRHGRCFL
jgi:hypothetical protein